MSAQLGCRWGLLVGLLGFLVSGCHHEPEVLPTLRIAHAPHDHHAPLFVAASHPAYLRSNGGTYLEEVSPKVEYVLKTGDRRLARVVIDSATGGSALIRRLAEDQFDMVFGPFPSMIEFIYNGAPICVVAPVMTGGNGLVVSRGLPIHDWSGFLSYVRESRKPVRIGSKASVTVQTLLFKEALQREGVSYSDELGDATADVTIVDLHGADNLVPALEQQLIDGFVVMQPYLSRAELEGSGRRVALFEDLFRDVEAIQYPCCGLAASDEYLTKHREIVTAFIEMLKWASAFIGSQPEEAAKAVAHWLGEPVELERRALPTITFVTAFTPALSRGAQAWESLLVSQGRLAGKDLLEGGAVPPWRGTARCGDSAAAGPAAQ